MNQCPDESISQPLAFGFDGDGGAVAEDFGDALHDLGCIVSQTNDGVRAQLQRMLHAKLECVLTRFFTQISQDRDVAADQSLQAGANRAEDGARSHDNATHDPKIFHNSVTIEFERRRRHCWVHTRNLGTVQPRCIEALTRGT